MHKWSVRLGAAVFIAATAFTLKGQAPVQGRVTSERLLKAADEPGNWMMYSHSYSSWRFSSLDQINAQTVKNLHVKWIFQGRHIEKFETTPLVVNGIMYLTRPENAIYALDAATGRQFWSYEYRNPARTYNCCGKVNRGLAMLGNTLFMNTLDMHVVAVDARSGHEIWKTEMGDYLAAGGYAAPGAPLVVGDKLIVGMAGGEHGVNGFLDAYDTKTGKRLWRFNTIPQPGEPNFGTWGGDSWKTGGVTTWNNGSYDPETNTLFWGTSNPWPDLNDDYRAWRQLVFVLGAGARSRYRKAEVVLPIHAARFARLGFDTDSNSARYRVPRQNDQGSGLGKSQRVLLFARPHHWKIPDRESFRQADLEQWLRRQRPAGGDSGERADAGRQRSHLAGRGRRGQLDVAQLQSAH